LGGDISRNADPPVNTAGKSTRPRPSVTTSAFRLSLLSTEEDEMFRIAILVLFSATILAACETPTTQRYAISADNNQTIKSLNIKDIGVANFTGPAKFDATCRALGPLQVADGLTHTQYIQKAFQDELKVAGAITANAPRVLLSGLVERLEFSSSRALTGGSWTIDLQLTSSNGQSMKVAEYYEFNSGFAAPEACRNTAEAFSRAVQNLVGKAVQSPQFARLTR
jgi:hypothetical protein